MDEPMLIVVFIGRIIVCFLKLKHLCEIAGCDTSKSFV